MTCVALRRSTAGPASRVVALARDTTLHDRAHDSLKHSPHDARSPRSLRAIAESRSTLTQRARATSSRWVRRRRRRLAGRRRTDLGRDVEEAGEGLGAGDAVGQGVVHLQRRGDPTVFEAFDDQELPQRARADERVATGTPRPSSSNWSAFPGDGQRHARDVSIEVDVSSSGTSDGHVRSKGARMTRWVSTGISCNASGDVLRMSSKRSVGSSLAEFQFDHRADVHRRSRDLEQDERAVERIEELGQRPLLPKPPSPRVADRELLDRHEVRSRHGQHDELGDPVPLLHLVVVRRDRGSPARPSPRRGTRRR